MCSLFSVQRRQRRGVPPQPLREVVRLGRELQVSRALLHPRLVPAGDAPGADGAPATGRLHVQFPSAQEEEGQSLPLDSPVDVVVRVPCTRRVAASVLRKDDEVAGGRFLFLCAILTCCVYVTSGSLSSPATDHLV